MRISDWSSDVCSSDLHGIKRLYIVLRRRSIIVCSVYARLRIFARLRRHRLPNDHSGGIDNLVSQAGSRQRLAQCLLQGQRPIDCDGMLALQQFDVVDDLKSAAAARSEEHTSELPSLMRISYAVFCFTNKHKSCQT